MCRYLQSGEDGFFTWERPQRLLPLVTGIFLFLSFTTLNCTQRWDSAVAAAGTKKVKSSGKPQTPFPLTANTCPSPFSSLGGARKCGSNITPNLDTISYIHNAQVPIPSMYATVVYVRSIPNPSQVYETRVIID